MSQYKERILKAKAAIQSKQLNGLVPRGTWAEKNIYMPQDIVYFKGKTYICITSTQGTDPKKSKDFVPFAGNGKDGIDAKNIEVGKNNTHIRWRYIDSTKWYDLVDLDSLVGEKGDQGEVGKTGAVGKAGENGKQVQIQVANEAIQWRYEGGTWINLIKISELVGPRGAKGEKGDPGLSAYEIWLESNVGSKKDFLESLRGPSGRAMLGRGGGGGNTPGASALADLTDVTLTNPANGEILKYNGSIWVNGTSAGGGDMLAAVYDPQNISDDAFDRANHTGTQNLSTIGDVTASATEVNVLDGIPATLTATELGYVDGVTSAIQTQLNAKQASDQDLTDISALTPSNDDLLQRKAGAWTNRTPAQVKTDLALVKGDVGLGNVDNTSDATKNAASVTLTNKTIDADANTITNIENADIKAAAAIAVNKLAAITASRAVVSDGSGFVSAATTTATEIGYVNGVTSAIQTQLDAKLATSAYDDATAGETDTGTSTTKYVSPDGLAGSYAGTKVASIQVLDAATALTTGDGKAYFRIPPSLNGMDLVTVGASVFAKSTSGTPTIQIARGRQANATSAHTFADMLSTSITIDANEYDSKDATTPAVINASNDDVLTGDLIRIDVDVAGTAATGLFVTLQFRLP